VVGTGNIEGTPNDSFAWKWNALSGFTPLSGLPSATRGIAYGANDSGIIAGSNVVNDTIPYGVIWDELGNVTKADDLLAPGFAGWRIISLRGINNNGWLTGEAIPPGSANNVAVLLRPISGPSSISYGDFSFSPGVMALDVTESSGTDPLPLYGPPELIFNGFDFDPQSFVASAVDGGADITDGQLNFTITSNGLDSFSLSEAGDYSLIGLGTTATQVFAGASLRAIVTQINGVDVAPVVLLPSSASVGFNLPPEQVLQPWSLGLGLDIAGQLGPNQRATRVEIVIDNQLIALSEGPVPSVGGAGTAAFIAKKDFALKFNFVPEPSTLGLAVALIGALRRRG
jgi:hypothetical protein